MLKADILEQLQRRMSELLQHTPAKDIEASMKTMLTGFFGRLDLVTREEFDVQREVLLRTREQLEQLEARLRNMEAGQATAAEQSGAVGQTSAVGQSAAVGQSGE